MVDKSIVTAGQRLTFKLGWHALLHKKSRGLTKTCGIRETHGACSTVYQSTRHVLNVILYFSNNTGQNSGDICMDGNSDCGTIDGLDSKRSSFLAHAPMTCNKWMNLGYGQRRFRCSHSIWLKTMKYKGLKISTRQNVKWHSRQNSPYIDRIIQNYDIIVYVAL